MSKLNRQRRQIVQEIKVDLPEARRTVKREVHKNFMITAIWRRTFDCKFDEKNSATSK
jgi:hypothetical protein